jgi:hypothetical protein
VVLPHSLVPKIGSSERFDTSIVSGSDIAL